MTVSLAVDQLLLVGAALLLVGVVCAQFADRLGVPGLLLFLGVGMVIGDDGLEWISLADAELAQSISVAALVVILFEGGLSTSPREVRQVGAPGLVLATLGVVVTAAVVAGGAALALSVEATTALLIGAVVASTDAAAVFSVLRRSPLPRRLRFLLEVESGANDPMAVLLTVGILETWTGGVEAGDWAVFGLRQLGGGLLVGVVIGVTGGRALSRLSLQSTALYPVLALGLAGLAYGLAASVGTSGFLAVYVAGILVAARTPQHRRAIRAFHDGLASTAQIVLFLLLGLLVFPAELPDVALPAIAITAVLVLVARPLAVVISLPWFGFDGRQTLFAALAGFRGAVPIVLATFPLTADYPDGDLIFDVVFFVVLASVTLQGLTVAPLARRLGLQTEADPWATVADAVPLEAAGVETVEVDVAAGTVVAGERIRDVPLPGDARIAAIVRSGTVEVPTGRTRIQQGDRLVVVAAEQDDLGDAIQRWVTGS